MILPILAVESPVDPGAKLVKIAGDLTFAEGPACAKNGDVYFTDQPNDRILRWDGKTVSVWKSPAGRSNGMAFDAKGNLITCADGSNELWSIAPDGRATVLIKSFEGHLLNGPNDVWVRRDGALFLTDPLYSRDYWTRGRTSEQSGRFVFFLSSDRRVFRPVATDLKQPNGIVGTPDGKTLYVSDIDAGKTYRYSVAGDGTLANKTLFCELGSDGMSLDDRGNVYLTGHGVTIFDASGTKTDHIDVPEAWTGNVTFGGKDRKTLFITASKGAYTLRMRAKGAD